MFSSPPPFGSKSYMFQKPTKTKWLPWFEKTYNLIGECMLQCTQKLSQFDSFSTYPSLMHHGEYLKNVLW
jgi:hypothetical protein